MYKLREILFVALGWRQSDCTHFYTWAIHLEIKKKKKRVQQLQSVFENNIFERIVIIVKEDFTCFFCGRLFLQYFAGMNNINWSHKILINYSLNEMMTVSIGCISKMVPMLLRSLSVIFAKWLLCYSVVCKW